MFKFIVCASMLVALTGADYDFKDPDFNELLLDDIYNDVPEPQRSKRDADDDNTKSGGCHQKKDKEWNYHCCSGEKPNVQQLEAIKEVKRKCIAEVRGTDGVASQDPLNCDDIPSRRQQVICVGECIGKKFGFLSENGDLERDALLEHSRKIIGDSKWKNGVLEEYLDKCLSELKPPKDGNATTCNPYPLQFHHCIWRRFVEGCPAELQIESKRCTQIRERLASFAANPEGKPFRHRLHSSP